ncbi:hypothetical protein GWK47_023478 [Chionoecetes opilio]|uniref:Uncharacterized protein n=1 Tax=Chionoecetes opilio TaxID=41210 RepID=A0A8J4XM97_CHIOP|nr:hypothetical protein GWK47_023478 [Chionoecetes opilio]
MNPCGGPSHPFPGLMGGQKTKNKWPHPRGGVRRPSRPPARVLVPLITSHHHSLGSFTTSRSTHQEPHSCSALEPITRFCHPQEIGASSHCLQYTRATKRATLFHSGLLSTSQRQLGFQHLKFEAVDGLGHPPGLMESSRTAEWFGWDLHHRGTGRRTEKFFIVLQDGSSKIRASFRKANASSFSLLAVSLVAKNSTRSSDVSPVSLCGEIHKGTIVTESFEDSNIPGCKTKTYPPTSAYGNKLSRQVMLCCKTSHPSRGATSLG